jgi:hypothetical protein
LARARDAARTYGKSDPIDAVAVARAALREDGLPVAHLDGPDRDVRLLVDHREDLLAERGRMLTRRRAGLRGRARPVTVQLRNRTKPRSRVSHRVHRVPTS